MHRPTDSPSTLATYQSSTRDYPAFQLTMCSSGSWRAQLTGSSRARRGSTSTVRRSITQTVSWMSTLTKFQSHCVKLEFPEARLLPRQPTRQRGLCLEGGKDVSGLIPAPHILCLASLSVILCSNVCDTG